MGIYDSYNRLGKEYIKGTRQNFVERVGESGLKKIIKDIFIGKNIRDYTEFQTQSRLIYSYSALLELYVRLLGDKTDSVEQYADYIMNDYVEAENDEKRKLDLWLLGLTGKGLDNITRDNILDYRISFADSMNDIVASLEDYYGPVTGFVELSGRRIDLSWNTFSLLMMAAGAQTLTIRGSEKSTNGKMFEKLILGSLLTIMGFEYLKKPPARLDKNKKLFWLSHMDANEREIDATFAYHGKAVNVDIGFIGKGNPEITLDKVTRFGAYKEIGGVPHDMTTMIIVDTVADNSDLFQKAKRVNGYVFQMKDSDWTIQFAGVLCRIMGISHELTKKNAGSLEEYFRRKLGGIEIQNFI